MKLHEGLLTAIVSYLNWRHIPCSQGQGCRGNQSVTGNCTTLFVSPRPDYRASILRQFLKLYTLFVYLQRHQTHLYLFPDITSFVTLFRKLIFAFQEILRGRWQRPGWVKRYLDKSRSSACSFKIKVLVLVIFNTHREWHFIFCCCRITLFFIWIVTWMTEMDPKYFAQS